MYVHNYLKIIFTLAFEEGVPGAPPGIIGVDGVPETINLNFLKFIFIRSCQLKKILQYFLIIG